MLQNLENINVHVDIEEPMIYGRRGMLRSPIVGQRGLRMSGFIGGNGSAAQYAACSSQHFSPFDFLVLGFIDYETALNSSFHLEQ